MLGHGVYDAAEVARLLGCSPEQVVRWSTAARHGPAIVPPSYDRAFSFEDLVSFRIALLVREHVAERHLRRGAERLRQLAGTDRPLASRPVISSLATSGDSFLSDLGGTFEDVGRHGQGVFEDIVRLDLRRIEFDTGGIPERWRPASGIVIDPGIQAGSPCLEGTRVRTATVADLVDGATEDDVAYDLDVDISDVRRAVAFEHDLARGLGLAA